MVSQVEGYNTIELEREEPIAILRLNRPKLLNAFSGELQQEVIDALQTLAEDDDIRVVILCGAGRAFSAGYDIASPAVDESARSVAEWKQYMRYSNQWAESIWKFPKPIIAAVHGYCLAGACEIAMLCDLTIASEDCKLGEPEIRFATGSPHLIMPWVVPMKVAKELLYSGKMISAQRAYEIGMVNEVVPQEKLMERARYHALVISKVAPLAVRLAKEAINRTYEIMGLPNAFAYNNNLVSILDGSETEEFRQFEAIRLEKGLRAALDWRDAQFAEVEPRA
jgi:enoyl-CoA hydratase